MADCAVVTHVDQAFDGANADPETSREILDALVRGGRWHDAANFYPWVEGGQPLIQARLLLAAGRFADAHTILATLPDEPESWFDRTVDAVLQGDRLHLPDLVAVGTKPTSRTVVSVLMMRAADSADRSDLAIHYAKQVLAAYPGDLDAARIVAVGAIRQSNYVAAVGVLDRAEVERSADVSDPLQHTIAWLRRTGGDSEVAALVTFGHFVHREKDPTLAVTEVQRSARVRWKSAYETNIAHARRLQMIQVGILALALGVSLVFRNGLPGVLVVVTLTAWRASRNLPGLDAKTSRLVRDIHDPFLVLRMRRYGPMDVLTCLFVGMAATVLAVHLPHSPDWLNAVETIFVFAATAAAVRGRRRWVRRARQRLVADEVDLAACHCLAAEIYRGRSSRRYVTAHLFPTGAVAGSPATEPAWQIMQCMATHMRFLDLPRAEIAIRLGR